MMVIGSQMIIYFFVTWLLLLFYNHLRKWRSDILFGCSPRCSTTFCIEPIVDRRYWVTHFENIWVLFYFSLLLWLLISLLIKLAIVVPLIRIFIRSSYNYSLRRKGCWRDKKRVIYILFILMPCNYVARNQNVVLLLT